MRFLFLIVLLLPVAWAELHMPLLAVQDEGDELQGSIAHLYVSKQYGPGRVFIDTLPLTKADTQMSTRLARQIACNYVEADCQRYDLFYVIRADSTIIGGPSASAAMAVLTVASLEGLDVYPNMSITGTINSGNVIGPVGGVKQKIAAAGKNGIHTVLIPKGEAVLQEENTTLDLVEYGAARNVQVIEVATLGEAVFYMTGTDFRPENTSFTISQSYTDTMRELAVELCDRRDELKAADYNASLIGNYTRELYNRSKDAFNSFQYYAAASYCFGSNVAYSTARYQALNQSEFMAIHENLSHQLDEVESEINAHQLDSISDLQTYMIVQERLREARDILPNNLSSGDNGSLPFADLAYAQERLHSVYSWMQFFGSSAQEITINDEVLKQSCLLKLSEAEESYQYISLYAPRVAGSIKEEYDLALADYRTGDYELCLFKASKAKAQANRLLAIMGVGEEELKDIIALKLDVAEQLIAEQSKKGRFPIVGYSYYEYAHSLRESDPYSALLYAEYALELSNLDLYLDQHNTFSLPFYINSIYGTLFFSGLLMGIAIGILAVFTRPKKRRRRKNPAKHS
ncbi:MAG: S16 family serine protease [Nanobdellota archaeon]